MKKEELPFYEQTGVAMTCRSYDEYCRMFSLPKELKAFGKVLDVAGGASSFTAAACAIGIEAEAADPQYAMEADAMEQHALQEIEASTAKLAGLAEHYVWDYYGSLERHRENRIRSLWTFMKHYRGLEREKTYVTAMLPSLPFGSDRYGLVLCSHFLFLYGEQFDEAFHFEALRELVRVCRKGGEVRIYPLVDLKYNEYPGLVRMLNRLEAEGIRHERIRSALPFLPKSTDLLCLLK